MAIPIQFQFKYWQFQLNYNSGQTGKSQFNSNSNSGIGIGIGKKIQFRAGIGPSSARGACGGCGPACGLLAGGAAFVTQLGHPAWVQQAVSQAEVVAL